MRHKIKNILLPFVIGVLISCDSQRTINIEPDLFHEAINEITKDRSVFYKEVIINLDASPLFMNSRSARKLSLAGDLFRYLTRTKVLNPVDTSYFSAQIDTTRTVVLNPEKLNRPTITEYELQDIFHDGFVGWDKFKTKYGDLCILEVSAPIFNEDKSLIVFSAYKTCYKNIHGSEFRFVLKKQNGKWKIINEI